jgi:hypothetical protein
MKPTLESFIDSFFTKFFKLYSIIAYKKVSFDISSSEYFTFFTKFVKLCYNLCICFFYISYSLLWFKISLNLAKLFFASAITIGLLEYFMLENIDWDIEPLLSITNKMIGGVIFDFTNSIKWYDFFRAEFYSYFQQNEATLTCSLSCSIDKPTRIRHFC